MQTIEFHNLLVCFLKKNGKSRDYECAMSSQSLKQARLVLFDAVESSFSCVSKNRREIVTKIEREKSYEKLNEGLVTWQCSIPYENIVKTQFNNSAGHSFSSTLSSRICSN